MRSELLEFLTARFRATIDSEKFMVRFLRSTMILFQAKSVPESHIVKLAESVGILFRWKAHVQLPKHLSDHVCLICRSEKSKVDVNGQCLGCKRLIFCRYCYSERQKFNILTLDDDFFVCTVCFSEQDYPYTRKIELEINVFQTLYPALWVYSENA